MHQLAHDGLGLYHANGITRNNHVLYPNMPDNAPKYSFVIPAYNEEGSVAELGRRLTAVMAELDGPAEVVLVDDGSRDNTYELMRRLAKADPRFKVIRLSRNFGHEVATTAGLDAATGDAVITMDGDLQHPPELVHKLIHRWRQGYDIVYGVMADRGWQPLAKRVTARLFYRTLHAVSDLKAPAGAGDFRLVDRRALDAFREMRETNRFVRGMWDWVGFRQTGVSYVPAERQAGTSKYNLRKLATLAADAIVGFSNAPLRLAFAAGGIAILVSTCLLLLQITAGLSGLHLVPHEGGLAAVLLLVVGVQLLILGIVGEYVGRIYSEVRRRPIYVIQDTHGFERAGNSQELTDDAPPEVANV